MSELRGFRLDCRDGAIGKIKDLLFDDESWGIRYIVADTGRWLPGRHVLLSPASVLGGAFEKNKLPVNLTRAQIESSPGSETDQPVSEQFQRDLHSYYGWTPYWAVGPFPMAGVFPIGATRVVPVEMARDGEIPVRTGDPHLRSAENVTGYKIHAVDGSIGHVEDFLVR